MDNFTELSIVIPAYERIDLLKTTLESIKQAIHHLDVEVIIVDDGSRNPLENELSGFLNLPLRFIRQENQGCVIAKNNGLWNAQGQYVMFIDSDDLVHPDKLISQVAKLNESGADVCYTDEVTLYVNADNSLAPQSNRILPIVNSAPELYLKLQPCSSNLIYRRDYLTQFLKKPLIQEHRIFGSIGEVWLYYNLIIYPAKIVKVDGYMSLYLRHEQERLTAHWEKLGIAALILMLSFVKNCPIEESTLAARRQVGESAFASYRSLPKNFSREYERHLLNIWKQAPKGNIQTLGGRSFQTLAKIIGIKNAAWFFRHWRPDYSTVRTLTPPELKNLIQNLSIVSN
ncbi:glycosyltransferase family 2 protein [Fortiea contorta]|uniref:glycosyltransferase family 2 protein n=1 Tax=Fortiea contorta TaxID=1892405 RepID=UPI000348590D|nr:glycosyltransferase family 2 protein [Fortiea contorta]